MEKFNLYTWLKDKSRRVIDDDGFPVEIIKWDANEEYPVVLLNHNGIAYNVSVDGMYDADPNHGLFFADEDKLTEFENELRYWIGQSLCNYENNGCVSDNMSDSVNVYLKDASKKLLDLARKEIEKENSKFKPKFTYNEKDYSELANKLIEFRNNTPLCSVSYRDGEGRKIILHYEKEILDLARKELETSYYTKVLDDRMVFKSELHATDLQTAYDMGKQDALKDLPKWKKATEYKDFKINEACILDDDIYPIIATNVNIGEYYLELDELKNLPLEK